MMFKEEGFHATVALDRPSGNASAEGRPSRDSLLCIGVVAP